MISIQRLSGTILFCPNIFLLFPISVFELPVSVWIIFTLIIFLVSSIIVYLVKRYVHKATSALKEQLEEKKNVEIELKRKQELLNNILDLIPIPIHIKDIGNNGRYVYWNKESTRMFGNALNMTVSDIIMKKEAEAITNTDKIVFESEMPIVTNEIIKTLDGREYETISHKNIIYDNGKKLLLVSRWDISAQNELDRKSKILSISMDALKAYSWFCDTRDGVLKFGDGFEATGGLREELNSIYKFAQKIHPLYRDKFINFMDEFCRKDSGDFSVEYEIDLSGDGKYEWWECRGTIVVETENSISYKYLYGMDINIDKHKQNELSILENKVELDRLNSQNELILNNTNSGLVFLDNNYVVQWENLSEYLPNHPFLKNYQKGCVCYNIVKGLDSPCNNCIVDKARISGKREYKEVTFGDLTVEITATPILDGDEQKGSVLKIVDITDKKRVHTELKRAKNGAETANRLMSDIIDRLPCLLFIKDATDDYRYIIANSYFCNMLGEPKDEVIGKTDFDMFGIKEAEKYRRDDALAIEKNVTHTFEEETHWQGQHVVWQTTKAPIEAINGHNLLIALSLDITEKISSYKELQEAKEKAELSNKFKSSFLANMSHEIRTPLNAIVGFSNLMIEDNDPENKKEYGNIINSNTEVLLRLIGDILDLSKIEAGMIELKYQNFDLTELFTNLASTLAPRITSADVKLICETPFDNYSVFLDKNRFNQVVTNFATNAIKFTTKGYIKMGYELVDNGIRVYVTDTGIGISQDKINRVFERFEKLDDFAQGTGLGMAISKAILEAFNGKIGVESKLGEGSTFWAWFPNS